MRRTKSVVIASDGRDKGKTFIITEMPAEQAETWAARALFAVSKSGLDVPLDMLAGGFAGIAALGAQALLSASFADAKPLLDEMMDCVAFMPDISKPNTLVSGAMLNSQIEEVRTRLTLRSEVLDLHLGFSVAAKLSQLMAAGRGSQSADLPIIQT